MLPAVSRYLEFANTAGAGALSLTTTSGEPFRLVSVRVLFSVAPTTSEFLTVAVDSKQSASHDAVLFRVDPSVLVVTSVWWTPPFELAHDVFTQTNELRVAYTNTDARTIGAVVTLERVE